MNLAGLPAVFPNGSKPAQMSQPHTLPTSCVHHTTMSCLTAGFTLNTGHISALPAFDAQWYHMGTAIKHPVPDRVKPLFVIFDIRAL